MIDEVVCNNGIKNLLDTRQYEKFNIDATKVLNFILHCAQKVTEFFQEIENKNQINEGLYKKLGPVGSQSGVLYGLVKVHRKVIDGSPASRPILSVIGIPTYTIANFLFLYLKI